MLVPEPDLLLEARADDRYLALARLNESLVNCSSWNRLAAATSEAFGELGSEPAIRLWGLTAEGWIELGHHPARHDFEPVSPHRLNVAVKQSTVIDDADQDRSFAGLTLDGIGLGALEVSGGSRDTEVIKRSAPVIAHRLSVLSTRRAGGVQIAPRPIERSINLSRVMGEFAGSAKRAIDHDRLSVYLVIGNGYAFERFGSPPVVSNERTPIPFSEVGLREVLLSNESLVSSDLGSDPRLIGSQNRRVAQAGFRGLVSVPLRKGDRPFGMLSFTSRTPGFYGEEDIPIVDQMSDQISVFIQNLRAQQRIWAALRYEAHEAERRRISRELYQTVAAATPAISDAAENLEGMVSPHCDEAVAEARKIRTVADRVLLDMRQTINDIVPPQSEATDLEQIIDGQLTRIRAKGEMDVAFQARGDSSRLPDAVRHAVGRFTQECLLNIARHSRARKVAVSLKVNDDLKLRISDNGEGFDLQEARTGDGLGLRHLTELAESIGGLLSVSSKPGEGTTVSLMLPDAHEAEIEVPQPGTDVAAESPRSVLRVFVAAHGALTLAGMCRLLERDGGIRVVGETRSRPEMAARLSHLLPDVVAVTTRVGEPDLRALLDEIAEATPRSALLVIRDGPSRPPPELLTAGAHGVIDVSSVEAELAQSVRAVATGITVVGSDCDLREADVAHALDGRERHILELVAGGETNAEIGRQLYLATKTVERQVSAIVRKIGARNRSHAAAIAAAHGVVKVSVAR